MANFNARPHFENRQQVQWPGESIDLSGQTTQVQGIYNTYFYNSYEDFLNGISGGTGYVNLISTSGNPSNEFSGYTNQPTLQPGIFRIKPPQGIFYSGNTNIVSGYTSPVDTTNYIATSFDSQGTVVWTPFSAITSMSGACTPDFYVGTIHPCSSGGTVTIEGNLLVRGETISATTIIETETLLVEDNNIDLNYGGSHTTSIGGGITVLSGVSNTQDSTIMTDSNGVFVFNPGLSSPTLSACTALHTSNIYGCTSPITLHNEFVSYSGGGILDLRNGGVDNTVLLGNDSGSFGSGYLYINDNSIFVSRQTYGIQISDNVTIPGFQMSGGINVKKVADTMLDSTTLDLQLGVIMNSVGSSILSGTSSTVVIGGNNIDATDSNTVYVPTLNIGTITTGETISLLAITSGGTVVDGTSMYGEICESCGGSFLTSGTTIGTGTTVNDFTDNLEPVGVDCVSPKCCTQWTVTYRVNRIKQELITTNYEAVLKYKEAYNAHVRCSDSNNTGINHGGKYWTADVTGESIPTYDTKPLSLPGVVYEDMTSTSTTVNEIEKSYKVQLENTSYTKASQSDFISVSESTMVTVDNSINDVIDSSVMVETLTSTDGYIDGSNRVLMLGSHDSTIKDATTSSIISSESSVISGGTTGTTIISGNGIIATKSYTVYVPNLNIGTVGGGASINNLGIDSSGNVVTGTTGGGETLAQTLVIGNTTGGIPISITSGDYIEFLPSSSRLATTTIGTHVWDLPDATGTIALTSDITITGLTTTGTSGPSTLESGILNVPEYSGPFSAGTGTNSAVLIGGGNIANGITSVAEGTLTVAGGNYSHAEGYQTVASGTYSHTEGYRTTGTTGSHAEGRLTNASGFYSHAEGYSTTSSGNRSHAEGWSTLASGDYSHVEGLGNIASGDGSHAEGGVSSVIDLKTIASGDGSHAEGSGTVASGDTAHAEGFRTTAIGDYSHSQGYQTTASGSHSHAGGYQTTASGVTSFIHSSESLVIGDRSVVLGGQNITGTTNDTVYVPNLNIGTVGTGTSVNNLGIDSSGNVVTGTAGGGGTDTVSATTTQIDFTAPKIFYKYTNQATGNISEDLTGAKLGITQKIYHNDASEPTYPAGWVLMGDGIYFTSQLNIIYCEWAEGSRVEYWYVQEQ